MGISKKRLLLLTIFASLAVGLFVVNTKTNFIAEATCYECTQEVYDAFCWRGYEGGAGLCPHTRTVTYGTSNCASRGCTTYFCDCTPNGCCGSNTPCNGSCDSKVCTENVVADSNCRPANPSCTVTWSTVPSTIKPNTNFTATITQGTSNVGWNNVMTYKDGVAVAGGTVVSGGYTWVVNSGSAASHELRFAVDSPDAGSAGPITYCTPTKSFSTINWPTASIQKPVGTEGSGSSSDPVLLKANEDYTFSAAANGTNLQWVDIFYASTSATLSLGTSWTRVGSQTQCNGGSSCSASGSTRFTSAGTYYVAVNANQVDGEDNAMPCSGNPSRPSGWTDCGPSDLLTVNASDVTATLDIRAVASTGTQRAPRTSGRLSSEVGGEGYVNPMIITLTVESSTGSVTVDNYYAALYSNASGSKLTDKVSFLSALQSRINSDPKNGILLHYNATNGFEVWNSSTERWQNIPSGQSGREIKQGNTTLYNAIQGQATANSASWQIRIAEGFGSKTLYTPIYATAGILSTFDPDFLVPAHYNESTDTYSATLFFSP